MLVSATDGVYKVISSWHPYPNNKLLGFAVTVLDILAACLCTFALCMLVLNVILYACRATL